MSQKRNNQIQDGMYDGRFREKVIKDKKKHQSKTKARKYRRGEEE